MQSHDGAIHILPALPDAWNIGSIKGLKAKGGFEVDIQWHNGEVKKIVIKSNLGGNCRIRVPNQVAFYDSTSLNPASGINPNPFFDIAQIKAPLISDTTKINSVDINPTIIYDFPTQEGKQYTIINIK
ncbi:glycoside hydrolase family 95-like protein [Bacteroidota bacterium]